MAMSPTTICVIIHVIIAASSCAEVLAWTTTSVMNNSPSIRTKRLNNVVRLGKNYDDHHFKHRGKSIWSAQRIVLGKGRNVNTRINVSSRFKKLRSLSPFLQPPTSSFSSSSTQLFATSDSSNNSNNKDKDESLMIPDPDPAVKQASVDLRRVSWISWWSQVVLTTISAVIFVFARSVMGSGVGISPYQPSHGNFVLAGLGILCSFCSIFWTWGGGARLSRRIIRLPTSKQETAKMLRRAIQIGAMGNLAGMLIVILGMAQTVGILAVKVLTVRPWGAAGAAMAAAGGEAAVWAGVQPLDILVVQANTNSLLSHYVSLLAFLYLIKNLKQLDPPQSALQGK